MTDLVSKGSCILNLTLKQTEISKLAMVPKKKNSNSGYKHVVLLLNI
jgi:hypothetical protein